MMERCEQYIMTHLSEDVTAEQLADICGYSLYHFCHVFKAYYNMAPGEFMRRTRLEKAAEDILAGKSITETAFQYGFDTSAGFSKAFRKQFGMSAMEYRQSNRMTGGSKRMKVTIIKKEDIRAVGYEIQGTRDSDIGKSGAYWVGVDFKEYPKYPENMTDEGEIGMWMHPDEKSGELCYFFGCVSDIDPVPEGFREVVIPAAQYAVFDVEVPQGDAYDVKVVADKVKEAWGYIFKEWMDAQREYKFDETKFCFEHYVEMNAQIYIPVVNA